MLTRSAEIEIFEAYLDIARGTRRDDILAVLKLADEHGGVITAEKVCGELLMGRPKSVGELVLRRCADLSLLTPEGRLSEWGKEALSTEQVFFPESDRYCLWTCEDPLLPHALMHLAPVGERFLWQDLPQPRGRADGGQLPSSEEEVIDLPHWLHDLVGSTIETLGSPRERVRILQVRPKGVYRGLEATASQFRLSIPAAGKPQLEIEGKFRATLEAPRINFEDAWRDVLGDRWVDWEGSHLRCAFEELSDEERATFLTNLKLRLPGISELGEFDDTVVKDVPIGPRGLGDTRAWASWSLEEGVDRYLDPDAYKTLETRVMNAFPELDMPLPSQGELAARLLRGAKEALGSLPEKFWYLQAPLDLNPNPSPPPPPSGGRRDQGGRRF